MSHEHAHSPVIYGFEHVRVNVRSGGCSSGFWPSQKRTLYVDVMIAFEIVRCLLVASVLYREEKYAEWTHDAANTECARDEQLLAMC